VLLQGIPVPCIEDSLLSIELLYQGNIDRFGEVSSSVSKVRGKGVARAKLDDKHINHPSLEHDITIEDVAYLCDMTPGSVRNSTTVKAKDPLKTFKSEGKVFVENESLIEWLKRRRGFVKTQTVRVLETEYDDFKSLSELNEFICSKLRNDESGVQHLETIGVDSSEAFGILVGGQVDEKYWNIDFILSLAKELNLLDGNFIRRATEVLLGHKMTAANLTPKAAVVPLFPNRRK
jgi:hypothetical protein